ncbi:MAG: phosphatidylserine decarboxylase [Candidatus Omnitrophica bacterium]|nr:phosphatidylserine decarboxylase [Candidatus Omnitrophota bacterium]
MSTNRVQATRSRFLKRSSDYPKSGRVTPVEKVADLFGVNKVFLRRPPLDFKPVENHLMSPAQSKVETLTTIGANLDLEEKAIFGRQRHLSLNDILKDSELASKFAGGSYAKFYLAPWDLHFLVFPASGRVADYSYKAGLAVPLLFMKSGDVLNERLSVTIQTEWGFPIVFVMIGSWMVNGIHHAFHVGQEYSKGEDLGYFKVGSSVVMACPPETVEWLCRPGEKLQIGDPIAKVQPRILG